MGLKGQNDPVLVLNAKGGEIKAKANGSATTCVNLKNNCKIWSLVGGILIMGKRGSFGS
jgi:hypothetical protein